MDIYRILIILYYGLIVLKTYKIEKKMCAIKRESIRLNLIKYLFQTGINSTCGGWGSETNWVAAK
ncbi:Uncharacterized protein FWK35_00034571 [Aphis craccivora]|uniref:Uncharacterized protein n=1 Tax=Aphis craccivora TaxID=307492 RepID=A0A6G0WKZ9_APHCR|nr:Uncharacterized protein FWK35_00034571 [Aphis craccivora]